MSTDNKMNHLVTGTMAAMFGFAAAVGYFQPRLNTLEAEMVTRPQVVVIDTLGIAAKAVPVGAGEEAIKLHYAQTNALIDELRAKGVVVLAADGGVLAAPMEVQITADDMNAYKQKLTQNISQQQGLNNG